MHMIRRTPAEAGRLRPRGEYGAAAAGARLTRRWEGLLFISPWLIGFILLTLGPLLFSVYLSLAQWDLIGPIRFHGLGNYTALFRDALFLHSLRVTTTFTAGSVPLQMGVALLMALLLNQSVRYQRFFRTAFYLPSLTPSVAAVLLWMWLLDTHGVINSLLRMAGVPAQRLPQWFQSPDWALPGLILMSVWGCGSLAIIYLAGLQGIPEQLYEAATIDGAGEWAKFRYVTLPLLSPTIFLTLILSIIGSFQTFTGALLATEGGPQDATLFALLYLYFNAFRYFHMGYASAMAWIVFAVIMALTLLQFRLARRWVYYEGGQPD